MFGGVWSFESAWGQTQKPQILQTLLHFPQFLITDFPSMRSTESFFSPPVAAAFKYPWVTKSVSGPLSRMFNRARHGWGSGEDKQKRYDWCTVPANRELRVQPGSWAGIWGKTEARASGYMTRCLGKLGVQIINAMAVWGTGQVWEGSHVLFTKIKYIILRIQKCVQHVRQVQRRRRKSMSSGVK